MSDERTPQPLDPRVRMAAERTLLAWIRTGLALMGFGFVVARFGLFLRELSAIGQGVPSTGFSQGLGIGIIVFGALASAVAAYEHLRLLDRLERGDPHPFRRWSLGVVVILGAAAVGTALAIWLSV